jgi:hypothetical protein
MFKGNRFRMKQKTTATLKNMFILLNEIRRFDDLSHHLQALRSEQM